MSLMDTMIARSVAASDFSKETYTGTVQQTVTDQYGSVTNADILVNGQAVPLRNVSNASGANLSAGMQVTVNYIRGNRHNPQVIGGTGASNQAISTQAAATSLAASPPVSSSPSLSDPVLLAEQDDNAAEGYIVQPGVNTLIQSTDPTYSANGTFVISAVIAVYWESKPDPVSSQLLPGTIIEVFDYSGCSLGLYRLMGTATGNSGNYWHEIKTAQLPMSLEDLTDVVITTPAEGQVLALDAGLKWTNQSPAGGGNIYTAGNAVVVGAGYAIADGTGLVICTSGSGETFTLPEINVSTPMLVISHRTNSTTVNAATGDKVDGSSGLTFAADWLLVPQFVSAGASFWHSVHVA